MTGPLRWPLAVLFSSLVMGDLVLAGAHGPIRLLVTLWFLLVCTGMAFVPLLRIGSRSTELATGVAVSVALDTVVATAIVEIGGLSATSGLFVLEAICLVGCGLQARRWVRARRPVA